MFDLSAVSAASAILSCGVVAGVSADSCSVIVLCNVINGSGIANDMMLSLNGMNDSYIFSLLPHILVLSNTKL